MLLRVFRQNQPVALLLLALLVLVIWPGTAMDAPAAGVRLREGMPLYALLAPIWTAPLWVQWVVGVVLATGVAVQLDIVGNGAELFERRNHLPALLFVLLMAVGPGGAWPDPALLGMPWVLWSLARTWGVQGRSTALGPLFDAGLLLGIATLWYLPYAFLLVVLWASVSVMRPFQWREYVLPVLGLGVVLFLCWGVMTVLDSAGWDPVRTVSDPSAPVRSAGASPMRKGLVLAVLAPLALASLFAFANLYQRSIMREKNVRSSFLALSLAMAVLIGFELLINGTFPGVLLAVPLAILYTHALLWSKRTWPGELALLVLLHATGRRGLRPA